MSKRLHSFSFFNNCSSSRDQQFVDMLVPVWGVPEALEAGVSPPKSGNCMPAITQNCSPNLMAPVLDPWETESPNNGYTIIKRYIYMYTHTQNCIVPPPPPNLYTTSSKAYEHCLRVTWSLLPFNGRPFFFLANWNIAYTLTATLTA